MGFENGTTALYLYPNEMDRFIQTINETDDAMLGVVARSPIEIVNFTNEEGSRFAPAMVASAGKSVRTVVMPVGASVTCQ